MNIKENESILKLVKPTMEYKEQVMNCKKIFLENNEEFSGCSGLEECETYEEWLDFDNRHLRKYGKEYSPSTVYLAIRNYDDKLVGIIDCRLRLSNFLLKYGGNIGYSILPNERRKGYAKEMLRLALEYYKKLGFHRVLITCDKNNVGSYKTIKSNGGILENEVMDDVNISKSGIVQRYWISLKKRYADRIEGNETVEKFETRVRTVNDNNFCGDIYLHKFIKSYEPFIVAKDKCIANDNYKWLEFYDYKSKIKLTTMYDENNEIIEWYFDIAREIGKENGIPYEDDLYLDVVLEPDGSTILLDEEELKDALDRNEISKKEYEEAYKLAYDLIHKINGKQIEVKQFTDKYLNEIGVD